MFLWVRLMLVTLRDLHSAYDLEIAVESLPSGLDEACESSIHFSQKHLLTFS